MGDWQVYGAGWSPEKTGARGTALVQGIVCDVESAKTGLLRALSVLTEYLQTYRRNPADLGERSQYFY